MIKNNAEVNELVVGVEEMRNEIKKLKNELKMTRD